MALSGNINGSVTQKSNIFSFYLTWSATQNVAGNYSDVTVKTYWKTNNTTYGFDTVGTRNASITINGETKSITQRFNVCASGSTSWATNPYLIQTFTQRVYHNANGSKSITISARANGHAASYGPSSSTASSADCTASGTITLNTIPRASSITSAANMTLGNKCSIKWTPASADFKYKLQFSLGSWNYTTGFLTPNTTSAYTHSETISGTTTKNNTTIYKQLPNSTTGNMSVVLITYNSSGSELGRSSAASFKVTIPDDVIPTVGTITLDPENITLNGTSYNYLVQNKNKLTISVSGCSAGNGSNINVYSFEGPSVAESILDNATSCSTSVASVASSGTLTYTVRVIDTRGRSNTKKQTITCYAYKQPSFTTLRFTRSADQVTCAYAVEYSPINGANQPTLRIYRGDTDKQLGSNVSLANGTTGSKGGTLQVGLGGNNDSTYSVYAKVTDSLGTTITSKDSKVFGGNKIFNVRPNGSGFAFGKKAETDGYLECAWHAKFEGDITVAGNATAVKHIATGSDSRLKTNVQDISIDVIDNLHPIQYELTKSTDGKTHYGFIAQDVVQVLTDAELNPETTGIIGHTIQNGQRLYTLAYTEFIPLLVKKCQKLQQENNEMRAEISEIKHMLLALDSE